MRGIASISLVIYHLNIHQTTQPAARLSSLAAAFRVLLERLPREPCTDREGSRARRNFSHEFAPRDFLRGAKISWYGLPTEETYSGLGT